MQAGRQVHATAADEVDHLKHRTGSLGGDQIPEDLKRYHADAKKGLAENESWKDCFVAELIERIAKAEAALAQKTRECEQLSKELAFRDFEQARDSSIAHDYGSYADIQKALGTEITMHAAWRKRAEEAEAALAQKTRDEQQALEYASGLEKINVEQNATISELREALLKSRKESDKWMVDFGIECKATADLKAQVEQLGRQVAEMSKPVTNEEWEEWLQCTADGYTRRIYIDHWLASRARTK